MAGRRTVVLALPVFVAALAVGVQASPGRRAAAQANPRASEYGVSSRTAFSLLSAM